MTVPHNSLPRCCGRHLRILFDNSRHLVCTTPSPTPVSYTHLVPHGVAVGIERWNEREDGLVEINAVIYCEKASHKGIIIGKRLSLIHI